MPENLHWSDAKQLLTAAVYTIAIAALGVLDHVDEDDEEEEKITSLDCLDYDPHLMMIASSILDCSCVTSYVLMDGATDEDRQHLRFHASVVYMHSLYCLELHTVPFKKSLSASCRDLQNEVRLTQDVDGGCDAFRERFDMQVTMQEQQEQEQQEQEQQEQEQQQHAAAWYGLAAAAC